MIISKNVLICALLLFASQSSSAFAYNAEQDKANSVQIRSVAREQLIDPASEKSEIDYRNSAAPIIAAFLPRKEDLNNAALYLFVANDGSVIKVKLAHTSSSKKIDQLILDSIKNLKLPPLPKTVSNPPLCIYYNCQLGEQQIKLHCHSSWYRAYDAPTFFEN